MHGRSRFTATRRLAALAMIALLLGGCSTWRMQGQAPATVVSSSKEHPHVRVTLHDGTRLEIYRAVVQGDSLVGNVQLDGLSPFGLYTRRGASVAVALNDIRTLETRTHSGGKTALLVAGIIIAAVAYDEGLSW
jgi:hypothetical protein